MDSERLTASEAGFVLGWHLALGEAITNEDATRLVCRTDNPSKTDVERVRQLLERGSRVVPIVYLQERPFEPGVWMAMDYLPEDRS